MWHIPSLQEAFGNFLPFFSIFRAFNMHVLIFHTGTIQETTVIETLKLANKLG
jgi:hypothetical protein